MRANNVAANSNARYASHAPFFHRAIAQVRYYPDQESHYHYGKRRRSVAPGDSYCGGQSMLKSLSLERFYRGSCCGAFILQWMAKSYLDYETISEAGEPD